MSLIITFMLEPAKLQMNWANARGASARRRLLAAAAAGGWLTVPWSSHPDRVAMAYRGVRGSQGGDAMSGIRMDLRGGVEDLGRWGMKDSDAASAPDGREECRGGVYERSGSWRRGAPRAHNAPVGRPCRPFPPHPGLWRGNEVWPRSGLRTR